MSDTAYSKTAACACGGLKVTVSAPPKFTHACSCLECQRRSGSAFSYTAFFDEAAVRAEGPSRNWRSTSSDAGRWSEAHFCPNCGVTTFTRLEALPNMICVPVGCFTDPSFAAPGRLYWSSRRHHWLDLPAGIEPVDTQES
jgi:hypothetical protein